MKSKPDDRRDNVEKLQKNINHTIQNMELAEDMIAKTDNEKTEQELEDKNQRRAQALDSMRGEIKDEAEFQKKQHS